MQPTEEMARPTQDADEATDGASEMGPSDDEPCGLRNNKWCNHVRSAKCPYATCRYVHLDEYVQLSPEMRASLAMQPLMTRHSEKALKSYLLDLSLVRAVGLAEPEGLRDGLAALCPEGWNAERMRRVAPDEAVCMMLRVTLGLLERDMDPARAAAFRVLVAVERATRRVARLWCSGEARGAKGGFLGEYFAAHNMLHRISAPATPVSETTSSTDYGDIYLSVL